MTHCPTEDILLDYIAGALNTVQAAEFERHAKECSRCEAVSASQAAVWRNLDEWKPAPVSAGFNRELWRRIDAEAAAPSWSEYLAAALRNGIWKHAAPLAVAAALVVAAFVLDHRPYQPVPAAGTAVVVTAAEGDSLERALDDLQLLEAVDTTASAKPASNVM